MSDLNHDPDTNLDDAITLMVKFHSPVMLPVLEEHTTGILEYMKAEELILGYHLLCFEKEWGYGRLYSLGIALICTNRLVHYTLLDEFEMCRLDYNQKSTAFHLFRDDYYDHWRRLHSESIFLQLSRCRSE
jgi:hypothetical protein